MWPSPNRSTSCHPSKVVTKGRHLQASNHGLFLLWNGYNFLIWLSITNAFRGWTLSRHVFTMKRPRIRTFRLDHHNGVGIAPGTFPYSPRTRHSVSRDTPLAICLDQSTSCHFPQARSSLHVASVTLFASIDHGAGYYRKAFGFFARAGVGHLFLLSWETRWTRPQTTKPTTNKLLTKANNIFNHHNNKSTYLIWMLPSGWFQSFT